MTDTRPDYGQTFARWRAGTGDAWGDYTRHPFVIGAADGTLPKPAFLHYLTQDYIYLIHYARAWALAAVKAATLDEMRMCAGTVDALVNFEMQMHVKTCAAEGIDEATLTSATEEIETLAYTRYVTDAGLSGDYLSMMAALAPCVLGYGEIGLWMAQNAKDTPYQGWIDTYAGDEYQQVCKRVGENLDRAIVDRLGKNAHDLPIWREYQDRFTAATRLEAAFWGMGLRKTT